MNALIDWLHAQDSYTPFTQLSPGSLHPTREGLLPHRQPGCSALFCHDCGWGVEWLHIVDALMMITWVWIMVIIRYTVLSPMCEARCGQRMQRMRPISPLHHVCGSQWVTPLENYGMGLTCNLNTEETVKHEVGFLIIVCQCAPQLFSACVLSPLQSIN